MRLWDLATGGQVDHPLTGHTSSVYAVTALTVQGRTLLATAGFDGTVRLWDPATSGELLRLTSGGTIRDVATGTHSDGASRFLAIAGDLGAAVLDIQDDDA